MLSGGRWDGRAYSLDIFAASGAFRRHVEEHQEESCQLLQAGVQQSSEGAMHNRVQQTRVLKRKVYRVISSPSLTALFLTTLSYVSYTLLSILYPPERMPLTVNLMTDVLFTNELPAVTWEHSYIKA